VVNEVQNDIYAEKERDYIELRHLLPENQMNLLVAIAREDEVKQPTAKDFLTKYQLGSASTINSALKALENKEMIYFENDQYQLYEPFLKRFLQN
jgi:SOS-response transcriptional repressor LexA